VTFFSGFALQNEAHFFEPFLDKGRYTVSGFSYGAIKAMQEVLKRERRIDKLQLFSPAFFQEKSTKFKRLQMLGYSKDSSAYLQKFTENCFLPHATQSVEYTRHSREGLEELLEYRWSEEELSALKREGVEIEVYLGEKDSISDVSHAYTFFLPYATVTLIKGANHFLQGEEI